MSYILDALRKAERERPPDRGPELFQVPGPLPPGPGRRRSFALAAAVVVIVGVAFAAWIGSGAGPRRAGCEPVGFLIRLERLDPY